MSSPLGSFLGAQENPWSGEEFVGDRVVEDARRATPTLTTKKGHGAHGDRSWHPGACMGLLKVLCIYGNVAE